MQVLSVGGRVVACYRLGSFPETAPSVTPRGTWSSGRLPVSAVLVSRVGVDQRWQRRGLGTSLMWHALELATAVRPVVRSRLVVAHGEIAPAIGFLDRFGVRAFDSDPRWGYLRIGDVTVSISTRMN